MSIDTATTLNIRINRSADHARESLKDTLILLQEVPRLLDSGLYDTAACCLEDAGRLLRNAHADSVRAQEAKAIHAKLTGGAP